MSPVVAEAVDGAVTVVSRWAFNTYVVHDGGAGLPLVVDPGLPSNGRDALAVVRRQTGTSKVADVVCTHGHLDHVAGVEAVCTGSGAGYHLPARCERYLAGDEVPEPPGLREVAKILPVLASQRFRVGPLRELAPLQEKLGHTKTGMKMPDPPAGFLADGDRLPGAPDWEVLSTPGHTDDSTCFYHRPTATLLSGDSVLTHDGVAWLNPEITSVARSAETEERLRALPVEHLLPGHGLPLSGDDLLGRARSFRERPPGGRISCRLARVLGDWSRV